MSRHATAPAEIELKLRLRAGGAEALEHCPAFDGIAPERRHETTRYFDTPDGALAAHGFTLRVRQSGNRRIQTMKTAGATGGAASHRGEWEWIVDQDEPALDLLAGTPAAALVADLRGRLEPMFATDIHRTGRRMRLDAETEVEAAIDRGIIEAGAAREPVDELELELKQGSLAPLYRLAVDLHEAVSMHLAPESKAARGYRLRTGRPPEAVHAPKLALDRSVRGNAAFRAIVGAGLDQILANVAAAEAAEPEGIHQLRVGLRRLRSALVLFAPLLEPHAAGLFGAELKRLGRVFGARRDRDVFCLETLPAIAKDEDEWIARLRPVAERDRAAAQGPVLEALHGPGFTSLALGLAAWCEDGLADPAKLGDARLGKRFDRHVPALLDRLAGKVARRAERVGGPEELHALRKSLKKLRYAAEFVAGLYKPKQVKRYRKQCAGLQELLGAINDARTTPSLAEGLMLGRSLELAPALARVGAWSAAQENHARRRLDAALKDFRTADPFWRLTHSPPDPDRLGLGTALHISCDMANHTLYTPPRPAYPRAPPSLPAFLRAVRTNALLMWPDAAYETDSLVSRSLGKTQMLLNAPDAIHHVLVENPGNYRRTPASYRILRPIAGDGLLLSEGEAWRHQRRTIAPAMAPRVIPLLARHIAAVAEEAVASVGARSGEPLNLLAFMQFTALEIAGRSMFSLEMGAFGAEMRNMLTEFGNGLAQPYLLDMLLPPSIRAPRDFRRRRFQRRWMALMDRIIEARLSAAHDGAPRDLFDLLRDARDPETGAAFTRPQLCDQVATMIVAGHETTAITLFWSLYLLAHDPGAQLAIARETEGLDLGPDSAPDLLGGLAQTRAVISETLRLYPPAFTLARAAIGPDRAGDIDIPKGAAVLIAPWVLHRHRRLWRDPDAFDPSRFLPGAPTPPRFAYLPFGAGPRVCVGAQFALAEATLVLAAMVQAFEISLDGDQPVMPSPVITTQPDRAPDFLIARRQTSRVGRPWAFQPAENRLPSKPLETL